MPPRDDAHFNILRPARTEYHNLADEDSNSLRDSGAPRGAEWAQASSDEEDSVMDQALVVNQHHNANFIDHLLPWELVPEGKIRDGEDHLFMLQLCSRKFNFARRRPAGLSSPSVPQPSVPAPAETVDEEDDAEGTRSNLRLQRMTLSRIIALYIISSTCSDDRGFSEEYAALVIAVRTTLASLPVDCLVTIAWKAEVAIIEGARGKTMKTHRTKDHGSLMVGIQELIEQLVMQRIHESLNHIRQEF